jgi:tRNA pseudouridine38-40 synthase
MHRIALLLEYNGSAFQGFQRLSHGPSVQQTLETALNKLTHTHTQVFACGRTDAGVHALGQVVHFDTPSTLSPDRLRDGLNNYLRPHVSVLQAAVVAPDFHARFWCSDRTYRYMILNRRAPSPVWAGHAHHVVKKLDITAMQAAAAHLLGEQDFTSFRSSDCQSRTPLCNIKHARLWQENDLIVFEITADHFLHQMVRTIVGTLIQVGANDRAAESIPALIALKNRPKAGPCVPAHGLYFLAASYKKSPRRRGESQEESG